MTDHWRTSLMNYSTLVTVNDRESHTCTSLRMLKVAWSDSVMWMAAFRLNLVKLSSLDTHHNKVEDISRLNVRKSIKITCVKPSIRCGGGRNFFRIGTEWACPLLATDCILTTMKRLWELETSYIVAYKAASRSSNVKKERHSKNKWKNILIFRFKTTLSVVKNYRYQLLKLLYF